MNIFEIKNTKYTAKINLSRGGNCISLYNAEWGAHILREPDYTNLDNPFLYGMPILFPVNRISGGKFLFEGREYHFPVNRSRNIFYNACSICYTAFVERLADGIIFQEWCGVAF